MLNATLAFYSLLIIHWYFDLAYPKASPTYDADFQSIWLPSLCECLQTILAVFDVKTAPKLTFGLRGYLVTGSTSYWSLQLAAAEKNGESGIRTHGEVTPTHDFQSCSLSHSDISPKAKVIGWMAQRG